MTTVARIYRPKHIKERTVIGGKLISCSESSGAMAVDAATFGAIRLTQEQFRALSSEPIPDPASPGLNLPQVVAVMRGLYLEAIDCTGRPWSDLWASLSGTPSRRVLLQVEMSLLGSCSTAHAGHMILVQAHREGRGLLVNDPMCDQARWLRARDVRAAAEAFADATNVPGNGLRYAVTRLLPKLAVST